MAFLKIGCPIVSLIIDIGDLKNEHVPLVETQEGFIAHWVLKYDRPQPNEFEIFKDMGVVIQLVAGVNCPEPLFATWFVALCSSGVSFVALDSDGLLVSK